MSGGLDKTGPDYEEERSRLKERRQHNKTLDAALNPRDRLHRLVFPADVQQTVLIKEEAPEEWRSNVDQKDPETLNIKEEEELRTSLDVEQLSVKEETDDTRFSFTAVPLKSEDDDVNPQSSQVRLCRLDFPADVQQMISVVAEGSEEWRSDVDQKDPESLHMKCHQHQVEDEDLPTNSSADQMNVATVGEDCGGAETTRNPDLNTNEDDSSSSETEVSEDDDEDVNSADFLLKDSSDSGSEPDDRESRASESCVNTVNKSCSFSECETQFPHKESVQRNMTSHSRIKYSACLVSKKYFRVTKNGGLIEKIQSRQKSFSCDDCGKRFNRRDHLNIHMIIHTGQKPFACDVCKQSFGHKSHLNRHTRIHTGQKPFACDVCGQMFRDKSHLNAHMRIHTGQKPFVCDVCGQQFGQKSSLNSHTRIHTGQKPFACEFCEQRFGQKSTLNNHIRIHTGQKPFACDVCGQQFRDKSTLNKHMIIHTGQKPFACDVCGQRFGRKSSLNAHMRIHTGQKPFACDVCGQRFGRRSHLKTHMRIHTGQNNEVINIKTVSKNTSKFTQS